MKNKYKLIALSINSTRNKLLSNKIWLFFGVAIIVCCYGFSLFNTTISIDDLALSFYLNLNDSANILSGCRWGTYLIVKLLGVSVFSPFIMKIIGLLFLVLSAIIFVAIIDYINDDSSIISLYVFALTYLSFPLINELFEYNAAFLTLGVSLFLVALALLKQVTSEKLNIKEALFGGLIIAPAMASYEATIFVYITMVLIILYLKNRKNKYSWFFDGLNYVPQLIVALVFRYAIGFAIIKFCGFEYSVNGSGTLLWFEASVAEVINQLKYNFLYYVVRADIYFPILEFVLSVIIMLIIEILSIKSKKTNFVLLFLIIVSIFALSLLQGNYMAYRTAQTVQIFVSFVLYMFVYEIEEKKIFGLSIKPFIAILLMFVILKQSVYLHQLLALNNQRSNNEASVIQNIGYRLYSEYDTSKTVVFCGEYQLGNFINDQITVTEKNGAGQFEMWIRSFIGHEETDYYDEFVKTNVNSVINWGSIAFSSQNMMKEYLSYYGFDINVVNNMDCNRHDWIESYEAIAKEYNMKPFEIMDIGDHILVYLGPTIER